jgi:hypothetical protein
MTKAGALRRAALGVLLLASLMLPNAPVAIAQGPENGWTIPQDIAAPLMRGKDLYGVVICDAGQNVHILWGKGHDDGADIYYRTDAGGSLSQPNSVLARPDEVAIALSAAVSLPSSILHLVWQNRYIRGDVYYSSAPLAEAWDARAWSEPQLMIPEADMARIVADNAGDLHLIYGASDPEGRTNSVYHLRSEDNGRSWSEPVLMYSVASVAPSWVQLEATSDASGRIHVGITLRTQEYGVYSEVGYMRSLDGGATWAPYRAIATQNEATPNISIIAPFVFGQDEVHLTWHDPRRMHMWSFDGGTTWSNAIQIVDLGAGFGGANWLAKDSAGVLRAVTGVGNGIYVSRFANGQWLAPVQIEDRDMDPHGQQMVVCQGNQLHVVYDDRVKLDTTVWYSQTQVDAPHVEQRPLPSPAKDALPPVVAPEPQEAPPTPAPIASLVPVPATSYSRLATKTTNPMMPVFIALGLSMGIVGMALLLRKFRGQE